MRPGYEGGFKDIERIDIEDMVLNVHPEWYYGNHDNPDAYGVPEGLPVVPAVVLY